MKVYVVTTESEWDGWVGTVVYASREAAVRAINARITENNDEEGTTLKPVIWPERQTSVRFEVGSYLCHCEEDTLQE